MSQKCSALLKFILAGLDLQAFGGPPLRPDQGNSDEKRGDVAQLVEQRTENPCVGGSIPSITTKNPVSAQEMGFFVRCEQFVNNLR